MAVRFSRLMAVIVVPRAMEATLSFRYTRKMISQGLEPMASAASMSPGSSSAKAPWTCPGKEGDRPEHQGNDGTLDLNGCAMMARETGMTQVSRMIKGMERNRLMTLSKI